jgi:methylmalonyl-CoA epimerase
LRERLTERIGVTELRAASGKESLHAGAIHTASSMSGLNGISIDHLGIAVRSIDDALAFWQSQLGMDVSLRETVAAEKVTVAMLPAGGPRVELLEPTERDSAIGRFLDKRGEGLHHVAFLVPDLAATVERLRASGARLLNEPRRGAGGHLYVFIHPASSGGVLVELIQEEEHQT